MNMKHKRLGEFLNTALWRQIDPDTLKELGLPKDATRAYMSVGGSWLYYTTNSNPASAFALYHKFEKGK